MLTNKTPTTCQEDYLEIILKLSQEGYNARSKDIAQALGVHRSTVTAFLKALSLKKLINYKPYTAVSLTPLGAKLARKITNNHKILCRFLSKVMFLTQEEADHLACQIEHCVSEEFIYKIASLEKFLTNCPHCHADLIKSFKKFWINNQGKK